VTSTELKKLATRYLLPSLPGFAMTGRLVFVLPVEHLLRAFYFESSAFSRTSFCVEVFVQPLYLPLDHLAFMHGGRLGTIEGKREHWWEYEESNEATIMEEVLALMQQEGRHVFERFKSLKDVPAFLHVFERFKSLNDFVKNAITRKTNPHSPYPPEMVAYGAILIGNARLAHKMFDRLEKTLEDEQDRMDYEEEILRRSRMVREAFTKKPDSAVAILNEWREQTAANLKLTKFLAPV